MKPKLGFLFILTIFILCNWTVTGEELITETPVVEIQNAQVVNATIDIAFGDISITGGAINLLEGEFSYSLVELKPTITYYVRDIVGELRIEYPTPTGLSIFNFGKNIRPSAIRLNNSIPMNLSIEVGAGKSQFNLGDLTLETLNIETGAGDITIDLAGNTSLSRINIRTGVGRTSIDLRGNWEKNIEATIHSGVGEVTVYLPRNIGVWIDTVKGLGAIDASNLIVNGNIYTNQQYGKTNSTLKMYLESGIGKVNLYQ